jgi:hypothetical protein
LGWIGPLEAPVAWRRHAWRMAGLTTSWLEGPRWWLAAACAGTVPLLLAFGLAASGGPALAAHQPISAVVLFFLLLAAVRGERPVRGTGALAVGFAAHSAAAIGLTLLDPASAASILPDGEAYWRAQEAWITTGADPEYDPANWVPAHLQLLVGIVALSFVSFGLVALMQGMYEVDLMNCYVGHLLARSDAPSVSLALGWHPWSVLRGLCYVVLVYEVASWSLSRFTGRPLADPAARRRRWALALALFAADGLVKITLLEPVRAGLAAHIAP